MSASQKLLDEQKAEMVSNAATERNTKIFDFAAYHDLETVNTYTLHALHMNDFIFL